MTKRLSCPDYVKSKPAGWHPEVDVPFFDDIAAAVADGKRRAGHGMVAVCAGDAGGQAPRSGWWTKSRWISCLSSSAAASDTSDPPSVGNSSVILTFSSETTAS